MRHSLKLLIGVAAASLSLPTAASAAEVINFDFTGGQRSFSFQLMQGQAPTRARSQFGSTNVSFDNVPGIFRGTNTSADSANISFGTGFFSKLGVTAPGFGFGSFGGPVLFDGSATSPTFRTGTFNLFQATTTPGTGGGVLTISAVAGVPEPATWAFLILGFGAVGGAMRRRAKVTFATA